MPELQAFELASALSVEGLYATSELLIALPVAVFATLPVWGRLRVSRREVALELAAALVLLLLAGPVLAGLGLSSNFVLYPATLALFGLYCRAFALPLAQKATVFLSVASIGSFITYAALLVDTFQGGAASGSLYLASVGAATQWALWALALAVFARPLRRHLLPVLESPATGAHFWDVAWLMPAAVILTINVVVPFDVSTLLYRRVGISAALMLAMLFALEMIAYALMYRLVRKGEEALAASERERRLSMQLIMEEHLDERMEAARRARHDLRQHDRVIAGFLDEGDLAGLHAYLDEHAARAEGAAPLRVCENAAVNALVVYYWDRALEAGATVDMAIELPRRLSRPQGDVTVVLGNLLENAVEALAAEGPGGRLVARARMDPGGAIFVTVDNSCTQPPSLSPSGGNIASTKHAGQGLGTQSVRAIAEVAGMQIGLPEDFVQDEDGDFANEAGDVLLCTAEQVAEDTSEITTEDLDTVASELATMLGGEVLDSTVLENDGATVYAYAMVMTVEDTTFMGILGFVPVVAGAADAVAAVEATPGGCVSMSQLLLPRPGATMALANDTVQKTLFMPLWAREIGARKCPQVLPDRDAARILGELGAGAAPAMYRLQYFYMNVVIRHYNYAAEIGKYLAAHPDAAIVEMGAGLSCQRRQMAAAGLPGAENPWYAVDLPDVVELRERHVPADGVERRIAGDLNDFSWMDAVDFDPARGAFFTGCGLFYYFTHGQAKALVCELARRFPGGALAFDIANHLGTKGVNKEIEASGIDVCVDDRNFYLDEPEAEVAAWDPAVARVEEHRFFDGYLDPHTYRRSPLTRVCQWVLQSRRLGFFVHVDFAREQGC